uniref:glutathione transferase n=1 Tax=Leersia perrieri TaxID=77586 RepID=A0A0D9XLT0_9ORYZ
MPSWQKASLGSTEEEKAEALKLTVEAIDNLETAFKECSKGKPFFGGDAVGYLDVTLGAVVGWARAGETLFGRKLFDATKSPLLAAWMERFVAQDAVKAVLPENEKLIEYGKMSIAYHAQRAAAAAAAAKNNISPLSDRANLLNPTSNTHTHTVSMAGGDELKMLGMWASPYVSRVKLALHLKGLSYDYIEEDLANKSDLFLRSNPVHKTVPVLIHNGHPICESSIIVQYIDETFPDAGVSLLPSDPYDRAVARFWAGFIDDQLLAAWRMVYRAKTVEERDEHMSRTLAAVDVLEGGLKECSKGKAFFGGDSVGYVDVVLGALVSWVHANDVITGTKLFDAANTPLLAAWLERFGELEAAKVVLQDVDRVVEYTKKFLPEANVTAADNQ